MASPWQSRLFSGSAIAALMITPVLAQDAAPATGTKLSTIETVVVTAERREQSAQEVPVSLTAISGDQLQKQGVGGIAQLQNAVPSLRFGAPPAGGENIIAIRGLSSQNPGPGGENPVSYSIDGVSFGRSSTIDPEFFDIERIEVLRGPQGTLQGRNSTGGAINIITNKPGDDLAGHVDMMVGDYNARAFRGWANVPLYECGDCRINARITGVSANHDGYQKNLSTAATATPGGDDQDYYMLRGQMDFKFNQDMNLLLQASTYQEKGVRASKTQWILLADQTRFAGQPWYSDPRKTENDQPQNALNTGNFYSGTFNANLGWAKFTSITGLAYAKWNQHNDSDSTSLDLAHNILWAGSNRQWSQEFRLASNDDTNPLKWIVGFLYYKERVTTDYGLTDTGLNMPPFSDFDFTNGGAQKLDSWAPFAQLDYDLGKTSAGIPLTVTLGLRYTHDKKTGYDYCAFSVPSIGATFPCLPTPSTISERWGQMSGKFGLSYKATDDIMLFANVSRGYIAGGKLIGAAGTYGPEIVWSYEGGVKSQWLDNTLQINLNAFYSDIQDLQVFVSGLGTAKVDNAGKAHVYGAELEFIAVPVDGLRINGGVSLLEAKYDRYLSNDTFFAAPTPSNFKGKRLNQTPAQTVSLGAEYVIDTGFGTITPRADFFWSSRVYFKPNNWTTASQKSYTQTNLSVTWMDPQAKYSIEGFVRNLENSDVLSDVQIQSPSLGGGVAPPNYTYYPPRTVGVRFGVNF